MTLCRRIITAVMAVLVLSGAAVTEAQGAKAKTPAQELKQKLEKTVKKHKTYFGHHDDPVYGHTWTATQGNPGNAGRSDVKELTGRYPGGMSWDLGGMELGDSVNLDGVPFAMMAAQAVAQDARGGINMFSWHPRNFVTGGDSWDTSDKETVMKIRNDAKYKTKYQESLRSMARFLKGLTDRKGRRIGVIFRPWHEQTGSWFWWGQPNCSVDDYKWLWAEMRRVFDEEGVDNVVWAFSPDRVKDENHYMLTYPGDRYVDIMGCDVYEFNGQGQQATYEADAPRSLKIVTELSKKHNKIPAYTETGLESVTNPRWFTTRLLPLLKKYPVAYVTVWRNAADKENHFFTPYKGHPGEKDFIDFCNNRMIVMGRDKK